MQRELNDAERQRLRAAQRVIQHAVSVHDGAAGIERAQRERYRALEVDPADGEVLSRTDTRHILVYRKLVRATLAESIRAQLPRTAEHLGQDAYQQAVARYCDEELPRSRVLRDVAYEFAAWASERWRNEEALPTYLADLARYELFEFDVYTARRALGHERDDDAVSEEIAPHQTVAFDGSVRLARFDHRVHQMPAEGPPEAGPVALLAYRDAEGQYRELELTPLAAAMVERLLVHGEALPAAVAGACAESNHEAGPEVIQGISEVLEDLSERGAALGGRRAAAPALPSPFFSWLLGARPRAPKR